MTRKWYILYSPGFLLGLMLLLINDHYLKSTFHNFITGKLSDLAGLFIFPIFFAVFFPRFKKHIYWITAIGFIFWKSPLSSLIIEGWNGLGLFSIQRIIDYTDLIMLLTLPLSWKYFHVYKSRFSKFNPTPVIILSAFAFIATSQAPQRLEVDKTYQFPYSLDTLKHRIFFHPNLVNGLRDEWLMRDSLELVDSAYLHKDSILKKNELMERYLSFDNHNTVDTLYCSYGIWSDMKITGNNKRSAMRITRLWHYCDGKKEITPKLLNIFESTVLPYFKK